jgi:hypothetical protein
VDEREDDAAGEVRSSVSQARESLFLLVALGDAPSTRFGSGLQFPSASILLIRSYHHTFFLPPRRHHDLLRPAHSLLQSRFPSSAILLHVFSNGGCLSLRSLNSLFTEAGAEGIPARGIVFDSCPGEATLQLVVGAFTTGLRSCWTRWPAIALITLLYSLLKIYRLCVLILSLLDPSLTDQLQHQRNVAASPSQPRTSPNSQPISPSLSPAFHVSISTPRKTKSSPQRKLKRTRRERRRRVVSRESSWCSLRGRGM